MKRKLLKFFIALLFIGLLLFVFRQPILKGFGNHLIKEDNFKETTYAVVLSGNALDRGTKAVELWQANKIEKIICTGGNQSPDLKAINIDTLESEVTRSLLIKNGIDENKIILLPEGTSTFEEAAALLTYCKQNKINEIAIISSKFHTKRVSKVFKPLFNEQNIQVFVVGANSSSYDEHNWWKSENGLIALNNEYIKLLYYFFKY